jgi:hypothetical protein
LPATANGLPGRSRPPIEEVEARKDNRREIEMRRILLEMLMKLIRIVGGPANGKRWLDLPLERRLLASSNAIHRIY